MFKHFLVEPHLSIKDRLALAKVHMCITDNKDMLAVKAPGYNPKDLVVAMRPLGADSTAHFAIMGNQKVVRSKNQIVVSGLTQLDGQYVVLVMNNMLGTGGDGNRRRR